MEEDKRYEHPSYGQLEITRPQSGAPHPLYGSSIQHSQTIRLRLYSSYMKRMLNRDWHHTGRTIVEVEMSQSQWAELVCSAGIGGGVPCTIQYLNGERIEEPPFISKRAEFDSEFDAALAETTRQVKDAITEAEELLKKPSVTKADRKKIQGLLYQANQQLASNIPFIKKSFTEQMDKTVVEAKAEVEATFLHKASDIAKELIAQEFEALPQIEKQEEN